MEIVGLVVLGLLGGMILVGCGTLLVALFVSGIPEAVLLPITDNRESLPGRYSHEH